jgi:hypothetical protein
MFQSIWQALSGKGKEGDTVAKRRAAEKPPEPAKTASAGAASTETPLNGAPKNGQLRPVSLEAIRMRAYLKWEAAGKPKGQDDRFWHEAEKELQQGG